MCIKYIINFLAFITIVNIKIDKTSFDKPVWVGYYDCYLHIEDSLWKLCINIIKEYKDDRHLVG